VATKTQAQRDAVKSIMRRNHPKRLDIPLDVLDDRAHRGTLEPRDLTAAHCGDPLPGYSALERKPNAEKRPITLSYGGWWAESINQKLKRRLGQPK
jgi:hypothetical protein